MSVLLATDGALRQAGKRTHRIIGSIDDKKTQKRVLNWIRASQAVTVIHNEVFGCYGGHSMGMETGFPHLTPTLKSLGCTIRQIDQLWLVKVMENVDPDEVKKGRKWFEKMLGDRLKYDGRILSEETLETQIRLYLAMKEVNEDKGFDFCGLKGQRELTEHVCLGDVPEMLMNDPYDWNGPKEPMVCATEADTYAAITMQLLKYITGGLPHSSWMCASIIPIAIYGIGAIPATMPAGTPRAVPTRKRITSISHSTPPSNSISKRAARPSNSTQNQAK